MTATNGAPVRTRREAIAARKQKEARGNQRLKEAAANILAISTARADAVLDVDGHPNVITLDVPSDPSAEAYVIATAMTGTREQRETILTRVPAEHMHHERHRQVYEGLLRMHAEGVDFDPRTLCIREPKLDPHYVESLWIYEAPRIENVEIAIAALAEDALRRTIINDAVAPLIESVSDQRAPIDRVTELARSIVETVEARRTTTSDTRLPFSDLEAAFNAISDERAWSVVGAFEGKPVVVLAGPEKGRKSWNVGDLVRAVTTGGRWLNAFEVLIRGEVFVIEDEYGPQEYARRLARLARGAGVDPLDVIRRVKHYSRGDLLLKNGNEALEKLAADARERRPALIIIDPFRNHLDGDENLAKDVGPALKVCARLRDLSGALTMVLHHLNRDGKVSGSRNFRTRADVFIEGSDEDEPVYTTIGRTLRTVDRIKTPFTVDIEHENDGDDTIAATRVVARFVGEKNAPGGLSTTARKLLDAMRKHREPVTSNKLGQLTNTNGKVRGRALTELREAGVIEVDHGKWSISKKQRWNDTVAKMQAARAAEDLEQEEDDCEPDDEDREPDDEEGDQDAGAIF